jgi:DNA-binding transcriptional LysR family regulator
MVGEHIKNKRLVSVLDNFVKEDIPIFAVYPSSRHLSPKVRVFVDFLIETYGTKPYWLVSP